MISILLGMGGVVSYAAESVPAGILGVGLLVLAVSGYLFPSRYRVTPEGFTISHAGRSRTIEWNRVNRVDVVADGVFLSPFPRPSRLDTFQGWFLRCPGDPGNVAECVRRYAPSS